MPSLELVEEVAETSGSVEIIHLFCYQCYPRGTREIAFCGTDVTEESAWAFWEESQECVMCVEVKKTFRIDTVMGRVCPEGHPLIV